MVASFSAPAFAHNAESVKNVQFQSEITSRMSYTADAKSALSISGGTATVSGVVKMAPTGKRVSMTTTLTCNGKAVKSWSSPTMAGNQAIIKSTYKLSANGSYKVKTTYTVYGDAGSESGTCYSSTIKY